jgi:hypothetical protein
MVDYIYYRMVGLRMAHCVRRNRRSLPVADIIASLNLGGGFSPLGLFLLFLSRLESSGIFQTFPAFSGFVPICPR